jgi:hypothetical protein
MHCTCLLSGVHALTNPRTNAKGFLIQIKKLTGVTRATISLRSARSPDHFACTECKSWAVPQVILSPPKSLRGRPRIASDLTRLLASACRLPGNKQNLVAG